MRKNVAGQVIGAQLVSATDGSAFTGAVTVFVTGDAGTQAMGSGACTHEGNGYHTYAPAQAETNYTIIAFTFTGSGAVPVTVQVFTTGYDPTAAQIPANVTQFGGSNGTFSSGRPEVNTTHAAGTAWASGAITAASIANGAIDAAKFAAGAFDAVWTVTARTLTAFGFSVTVGTNNDKTGYGLADDAITSAKFDESTAFPLKSADAGSTLVARTGADGDTLETLSDQLDGVAAASATAVWANGTRTLTSFGTLVADVATAVWAAGTRLLTGGDNIVLAKGTGVTGFNDISASDVWNNATRTLTSFGTLVADVATAVWGAVTRTLTSGANIVLAKGTGVTGFNDVSSSDVQTAATAALNAYDPPTKAELDGAVAPLALQSTLVAGVSAVLSAIGALNNLSEADIRDAVGLAAANLDIQLAAIPAASEAATLDTADGCETGLTQREAGRIILAAAAGLLSGTGTPTMTLTNPSGSKPRIVATVDGVGNRTAVTVDGTP